VVSGALLALAACSEGTGPPDAPEAAVRIAYLESGVSALQIVEEGEAPSATAVENAVPFAALENGLVLSRQGGVSLYYLDGSSITVPAFIGFGSAGGATSPDGERIAYSRVATGGDVFLHLLNIVTGAHDSIEVSDRDDVPAAVQIAGRRPVWSPSGDSVAFVLPNPIGVQLFLYEVVSKRIEVFAVPVAVTTYARPLEGWPYWDPNGSLHFVAWRFEGNTPTDTLVVMRIFPRARDRRAELVFAAHTESLPIEGGSSYSFSADGRKVALSVRAAGRTGIFLMHRGVPVLAPVIYGPQLAPIQPLLIR
jgi:Tol biopolymer transport system component